MLFYFAFLNVRDDFRMLFRVERFGIAISNNWSMVVKHCCHCAIFLDLLGPFVVPIICPFFFFWNFLFVVSDSEECVFFFDLDCLVKFEQDFFHSFSLSFSIILFTDSVSHGFHRLKGNMVFVW